MILSRKPQNHQAGIGLSYSSIPSYTWPVVSPGLSTFRFMSSSKVYATSDPNVPRMTNRLKPVLIDHLLCEVRKYSHWKGRLCPGLRRAPGPHQQMASGQLHQTAFCGEARTPTRPPRERPGSPVLWQ